jgi:hypothetical protein
MKYEDERTGVGILIAFWCIIGISVIMCIEKSVSNISINILIGFGLILSLIYFPTYKRCKKRSQEYQEIKEKGQKVQGTIIDYSATTTKSGDSYTWHYTVTVSYIDPYTKQEKTYVTPDLTFNPIQSLGSKLCSVYVLNEKIYVTDFIKREKNQENIWNVSYTELEKRESKKAIIFIILFLLTFLTIVFIGLKPLIFKQ